MRSPVGLKKRGKLLRRCSWLFLQPACLISTGSPCADHRMLPGFRKGCAKPDCQNDVAIRLDRAQYNFLFAHFVCLWHDSDVRRRPAAIRGIASTADALTSIASPV